MTTYDPPTATYEAGGYDLRTTLYPNPAGEFVAVQVKGLLKSTLHLQLADLSGRVCAQAVILPGSTLTYLDTRTLYDGVYILSWYIDGKLLGSERLVVQN